MKKVIIKVFALILTLVTVIASPSNVFASTNAMESKSTSEYTYIDQSGNELIFPTAEDYELYMQAHRTSQYRYGEEWRLQETLASSKLNHYFVGYHSGTPNWTKASSYTITKGKSFNVSANYPWQGVTLNIGFSYSFSVATTIPANSNKYSRLGVYADYTLKKERYAEYQYGQPTGNTRVSTYSTRTANYIDPVYQ